LPEVSVVIPAFNAAPFLAEALSSVLAQTVADHEIIVVDDGSTDDTPALLRRFIDRIRVLRQENKGVANARNRGISASLAPWVAFLDADDVWLPGKLEKQLDALRRNPDRVACATAFTVVDSALLPVEVHSCAHEPDVQALLLRGNLIGTPSTVVCRRSVLQEMGGFDNALSQCADWDLWLRICRKAPFVCVDESLVLYRRHATNMSHSVGLLERDSVRVLERFFAASDPVTRDLRTLRDPALGANWKVLAGSYWHAGRRLRALLCACRSLRRDRRQLRPLLQGVSRLLRRN
jgi:glycosyltransferase involved in cell wall biosynthesis